MTNPCSITVHMETLSSSAVHFLYVLFATATKIYTKGCSSLTQINSSMRPLRPPTQQATYFSLLTVFRIRGEAQSIFGACPFGR